MALNFPVPPTIQVRFWVIPDGAKTGEHRATATGLSAMAYVVTSQKYKIVHFPVTRLELSSWSPVRPLFLSPFPR